MLRDTRLALELGILLGLLIGTLFALTYAQRVYIADLEVQLGIDADADPIAKALREAIFGGHAAPDAAIPPSDPEAGARITIPDTTPEEGQA